jgi:hypothetical protein
LECNPEILIAALELGLVAIRKLPSGAYLFELEQDATFSLADCDHLWDNVFSVRVMGWGDGTVFLF